MSQFSNSDKQEHGKNAKVALESILHECKNYAYIKEIVKDYRCGYAEYDNTQFYCNFLIIFQDNTKWIVNITTSFRSDRLKGNQWDTYNIKEIDSTISKSVLVYPDDLSEEDKDDFIAYKFKIVNKIHFSAMDDIVGQQELFELIENYANKNLSVGVKKDLQGNNFESYISNVLSNEKNLEKWKTSNPKLVGMNYNFFEKILICFNLDKNSVVKINATSDKTMDIKNASASFVYNDVEYSVSKILSLGGSAKFGTNRYVEVEVSGACKLTVVAKSSGSSDRTLDVRHNNSSVGTADAKASLSITTIDITNAGTYQIGSTGSGIYIYYIIVEYFN